MATLSKRYNVRKPPPRPFSVTDIPIAPRNASPDPTILHRLHKSASSNRLEPLFSRPSPRSSPQPSLHSSGPSLDLRALDLDEVIGTPYLFSDLNHSASSAPQPHSTHLEEDASDDVSRGSKRLTWLPGKPKSISKKTSKPQPVPWLLGCSEYIPYNLQDMLAGKSVPELWDESGDVLIYLFPKESGHDASFKIKSHIISASPVLMAMASEGGESIGHAVSTTSVSSPSSTTGSVTSPGGANRFPRNLSQGSSSFKFNLDPSPRNDELAESPRPKSVELIHLYLPMPDGGGKTPQEDVYKRRSRYFFSMKNLFAFLLQQPIMAAAACPNIFEVMNQIAVQLTEFKFSNHDGSTFGQQATVSLDYWIEKFHLADMRAAKGDERILQTLIIAERMKSQMLYNNAYTHAVGRYHHIREYRKYFKMVSDTTQKRMERSAMDLENRIKSVEGRLNDCEFPSLFSGIANSTSSAESKFIRFKSWKNNFFAFRRFALGFYKNTYGSWPPKASRKASNGFKEPSLRNRQVLQILYSDFESLYTSLVDQTQVTTRTLNAEEIPADTDPTASVLRQMLTEFDRASPPVQPPMPFDLPIIPTVSTIDTRHAARDEKERIRKETVRLPANETIMILTKSHNRTSTQLTPFLTAFYNFEQAEAQGRSAQDLEDMRYGHWLFVYVILQSLPMTVVDVPDLVFTEQVQYLLCIPALGTEPWVEDRGAIQLQWYETTNGNGMVSIPSDVVIHGVEGVYRRSHCWQLAQQWIKDLYPETPMVDTFPSEITEEGPLEPSSLTQANLGQANLGQANFGQAIPLSPLVAPPSFGQLGNYSRPSSAGSDSRPGSRNSSRGSITGSPLLLPVPDRGRRVSRQRISQAFGPGLEPMSVPEGYERVRNRSQMARLDIGSSNSSPPIPEEETVPSNVGKTRRDVSQGPKTFEDIFANITKGGEEKKEKRKRIGKWGL